jgi:hypothetical protein
VIAAVVGEGAGVLVGLVTGALVMGALVMGALAMGALVTGALAMGALVTGALVGARRVPQWVLSVPARRKQY